MLDVEGLEFSYGDMKVLDGINFTGQGDRIISVLGPNGVGKTTLLRCLCGILRPQNGRITLEGSDATRLPRMELAKLVSYVPQRSQAARSLVFDSVLIGRRPHMEWAVTRKDLDITWEVIKSMGLEDIALRYADEISGGEYQKVIIARAMVQQPRVLILDEPTNNLDVTNQHMTMRLVAETVRSRGICTIMSMHDINLAAQYSDELVFMKSGRIFKRGGREIVDSNLISQVYGLDADVIEHNGNPLVVPRTAPLVSPMEKGIKQ